VPNAKPLLVWVMCGPYYRRNEKQKVAEAFNAYLVHERAPFAAVESGGHLYFFRTVSTMDRRRARTSGVDSPVDLCIVTATEYENAAV
jgi:hypothetical protein